MARALRSADPRVRRSRVRFYKYDKGSINVNDTTGWDVRYEGRHVADAGHDAGNHAPAKRRPAQGCGLMDDRTDAVGLHDAPDEERNARYWDYYCLQCEQVPAAVREQHYTEITNRSKEARYILWMGNQMAGREMSQNRKKHMKSLVVVPEDAGR